MVQKSMWKIYLLINKNGNIIGEANKLKATLAFLFYSVIFYSQQLHCLITLLKK